MPICGFYPITNDHANELLVKWKHKLGPCNRPFRMEVFALVVNDEPVSVAISASIVHGPVYGYQVHEVLELARLASSNGWANRVMLRVWRECLAPTYKSWKPKAVVSYSHNALHSGDIYRFDGWKKVKDDCGTDGKGGNWGRRGEGYENVALHGKKSLWVYEYPQEVRV
jgi:antitoxin VapB